MTCGTSQSAEIRRLVEKSHVWVSRARLDILLCDGRNEGCDQNFENSESSPEVSDDESEARQC